ncbi:MAG: hypothetical protein HY235_21765 [Acidobacteria bacterium]|nr:hypothetical protein [Acidobacteriota bacterium]
MATKARSRSKVVEKPYYRQKKGGPTEVASCSGECKFQEYEITGVQPVAATDGVAGNPGHNIPNVQKVEEAVKADPRFQRVSINGCETGCDCQRAAVELETRPINYRVTIRNIEAFTGSGVVVRVAYKVKFKVTARIVKGICMPKPEDA